MIFICGYCKGLSGSGRARRRSHFNFQTWEDLLDHLINTHRFRLNKNKLVRR